MQSSEIIEQVPVCYVHSCSECCSLLWDGKPNVNGQLHQQFYRKGNRLDCSSCPVFRGIADAEWDRILSDIDGTA